MKNKKFVNIIWGYSDHMHNFAPEENYHLHVMECANNIGLETIAIVKNNKHEMENDPNFKKYIKIVEYKNFAYFLYNLIKFSLSNSVFYVNSYEWQSFVVPFIARKTIFMAHTQPKRKTKLKQKIQNFVYLFFTFIRLNNESEKEFLIKQGIKESKLKVIPLVVSNKTFRLKKIEESRKDLVYFGNVTKHKNLKTIIKSFGLVRKKFKLKLHIIGNICDQDFYEYVEKSNYKKDILIHGFMSGDKLVSQLNKNLIYINSSITEGQCVAVYDAALCGCALCLPKIMSFEGVFKETALFHDVFDYKKLAFNINKYLENDRLIKKHTDKNITIIKKEYSEEKISSMIKKLITEVC